MDGTLIESVGESSNALHKEAFSAAYQKVFGLATNIDTVKHHGGTDPLILIKVLVDHHLLPHAEVMMKLKEMEGVMIEYYLAHAGR